MVNYLRLSITDRCNLRCIYCMPSGKNHFVPAYEILSLEEIVRAVGMLSRKGIKYVRITGGEPLLRSNVETLIRMLRDENLLKEISMTTNGVLLGSKLSPLIGAGLNRLNLSLNTFKKDRYEYLTGVDKFDEVFSSIKNVLSAPTLSLKINTVIFKGVNDDEIEDFAAFTLKNRVCVRFIEYFPTNNGKSELEFMPNFLIKDRIKRRFGRLIPDETKGNGPAVNFRIEEAKGQIGFINTNTGDFCQNCNRLRLTAQGRLFPCLFSSFNINLKQMLRGGVKIDLIQRHIDGLIFKKQDHSKKKIKEYEFAMSDMGG